MKRIERHNYLQKLIAFKDKKLIKVITGIRRCGKSTIMEIYRDWLIAHGVMQSKSSISILRTMTILNCETQENCILMSNL